TKYNIFLFPYFPQIISQTLNPFSIFISLSWSISQPKYMKICRSGPVRTCGVISNVHLQQFHIINPHKFILCF
ncbi:hypothetical protein KSS87_010713, partial [Heliosperma pusillum]